MVPDRRARSGTPAPGCDRHLRDLEDLEPEQGRGRACSGGTDARFDVVDVVGVQIAFGSVVDSRGPANVTETARSFSGPLFVRIDAPWIDLAHQMFLRRPYAPIGVVARPSRRDPMRIASVTGSNAVRRCSDRMLNVPRL